MMPVLIFVRGIYIYFKYARNSPLLHIIELYTSTLTLNAHTRTTKPHADTGTQAASTSPKLVQM
jgi:hypothetical protein